MIMNILKLGGISKFRIWFRHKVLRLGTAIIDNACFDPVLKNGDLVGTDEPATNLYPPHASDGTPIYSFTANVSTGDFILKMGDTGDIEIDNALFFVMRHNGMEIGMQWDETNKYYLGNDYDAAQYFNTKVSEKLCFTGFIIPELLQYFDFEKIDTKG